MTDSYNDFSRLSNTLSQIIAVERFGEIEQFMGVIIKAQGPAKVRIGETCDILSADNYPIMQAQVVGFERNHVFLMPFGQSNQLSQGCKIRASEHDLTIKVGEALLGRVVDAFARPIDNQGEIHCEAIASSQPQPHNPLEREAISQLLETQVPCIDTLLTLGRGQRVGLFAGSGVGKSHLLGQIAKHVSADVNVIALIGERGREVNEFIEHILGEQGLQKSVVVVATADQSALMRKQAVYTATAIAEYFCQQNKDVVLMMDSITRFAMAQREISLALGEPPTARGYTPSVFSLLPSLVERGGNFSNQGSISAFYTVLVEGDDFNEPIADHMRSLLDGHIVLTRKLAHSGHYPAIDVLQSISRLSSQLQTQNQQQLSRQTLSMINTYEQARDMIEIGAYQQGANPKLDKAISKIDKINQLIYSSTQSTLPRQQSLQQLHDLLEVQHDN